MSTSPSGEAPLVDLVLTTVDRTAELERFLESLAKQSFRSFRLIVVDQNADDRLLPILAKHEDAFPIVRFESSLGLSHGRNVGLRDVEGEIVGFPDDDCWYPPDLLDTVVAYLTGRPDLDGVGGRTTDAEGRPSLILWAKADRPVAIERANIWRTAVAVTMFLRRPVVSSVDGFDETLGAGAGTRWGSGEETDYFLRVLAAGFKLEYDARLGIYHDSPEPPFSRAGAARAYGYGLGNGRVLRRHGYPWWFVAYRVAQLTAGAAFFLVRGRFAHARFYWAMARGRAVGWFQSRA